MKNDPFKLALQRKKKQQIIVSETKDVFKTLEDLFSQNALLAAESFQANMHLLNAEQLAKCATMFAGKSLDIRMAREKGFKDQPVKTEILIMLKETLETATPAKVIDVK